VSTMIRSSGQSENLKCNGHKLRILIADDQPKVRYALQVLLAHQPGIEVIGEAVDADDLLRKTEKNGTDMILLDWELPGFTDVQLIKQLRLAIPDIAVIALSGRAEAGDAARSAGVNEFVSKVEPPEHLLTAIAKYA
jgi:DNA-binding NarL/FixJ family response regulator